MNSYNTGSSAYKYDYEEYYNTSAAAYDYELENTQKKIQKRHNERINAKEKKNFALAVSLCVCLAVIFSLCVALLYTRVMFIRAANEVGDLKEKLVTISSANSKRSMEIEQSVDLKKIEELAITQHNMQRPDKTQTIYVNVKQDDYAEVINKKHHNIFKGITHNINKVLAYLN